MVPLVLTHSHVNVAMSVLCVRVSMFPSVQVHSVRMAVCLFVCVCVSASLRGVHLLG